MQLEVLQEYVVFTRHMNFTHAARELHVAQSTLSKHVADMEKEVGFPLVVRGKVLELTAAGRIMFQTAQHLVQSYEEGLRRCADAQNPIRLEGFANADVPGMDEFLASCYDLPLEFTHATAPGSEPYYSALKKGSIDVFLSADLSHRDLFHEKQSQWGVELLPLGSFPGALAFSKANPLARREKLTREDLFGSEFLIPSGRYFEQYSELIKKILGDDLRLKFFALSSDSKVKDLAYLDLGQSIFVAYEGTIRNVLGKRNDLVIHTEIDSMPLSIPGAVLIRQDESNPLVTQFIQRLSIFFGTDTSFNEPPPPRGLFETDQTKAFAHTSSASCRSGSAPLLVILWCQFCY